MLDTEAFREFKQALTLLRDNYAGQALPHMRRAMDLDKNNPYYMSYLGVVLARSEQKWGEAERLCDTAVRMKRNQAQLYLNLAEVYATAGRRAGSAERGRPDGHRLSGPRRRGPRQPSRGFGARPQSADRPSAGRPGWPKSSILRAVPRPVYNPR